MASELAGKRPVGGGGAFREDAEEDIGAGGEFGKSPDVGLAVRGEQADSLLEGVFDFRTLLDRVAVADAVGRDSEMEQKVELVDARDVEIAPQVAQQDEYFGSGIRLDGVMDLREREILTEFRIFFADNVEIDDQKRRLVFFSLAADQFLFRAVIILKRVDRHTGRISCFVEKGAAAFQRRPRR